MHVGIIPDGNRRWLQKNNQSDLVGVHMHRLLSFVRKIISNDLPKELEQITELSLYLASKANLLRKDQTRHMLFAFISKAHDLWRQKEKHFSPSDIEILSQHAKKMKIVVVGERRSLPMYVQQMISDAERLTADGSHRITVAFNYDDKVDVSAGYGDRKQSNMDLVFRSGGEKRLSGFFPLHVSQAEFFFSDLLWPDVSEKDIVAVLKAFNHRNRRFGL